MASIVGIDGKIEISTNGGSTWTELSERNEYSISTKVDVAEHKTFVASLADAWVTKARTWMNWSGSLSGYYDDASSTIFDRVIAGTAVMLRFFPSRSTGSNKYWSGTALLTNVEVSAKTDDFVSLNCDFEGSGALTWTP